MEQTWEVVDVRRFKPLLLILIVLVLLIIALGSSIVNIGGDEVGIVEKKFGGGKLPQDRILAVDGQNGVQAQILAPGWHFFYWPWKYNIYKNSNKLRRPPGPKRGPPSQLRLDVSKVNVGGGFFDDA